MHLENFPFTSKTLKSPTSVIPTSCSRPRFFPLPIIPTLLLFPNFFAETDYEKGGCEGPGKLLVTRTEEGHWGQSCSADPTEPPGHEWLRGQRGEGAKAVCCFSAQQADIQQPTERKNCAGEVMQRKLQRY